MTNEAELEKASEIFARWRKKKMTIERVPTKKNSVI